VIRTGDRYVGDVNVKAAQMDKATFLSLIEGTIDVDQITETSAPFDWGWWRYEDTKIVWGCEDWPCAIAIVCLGKSHTHSMATCSKAVNPPESTDCIIFCEQESHAGRSTQDEEICYAALAALPYKEPTATGDITKVTLDGKLLPEDGTLDWVLHDKASVRVYFKNIGDAAGAFNITVTYNGTVICEVTTDSIPADGKEYYIDCGSFTPDTKGIHTLIAEIEP